VDSVSPYKKRLEDRQWRDILDVYSLVAKEAGMFLDNWESCIILMQCHHVGPGILQQRLNLPVFIFPWYMPRLSAGVTDKPEPGAKLLFVVMKSAINSPVIIQITPS
jgi:hypothetical protein